MSERQEHKRRYNQRLEFIAKFEEWLEKEPPCSPAFCAGINGVTAAQQ